MLGDDIEATVISLVETKPKPQLVTTISITAGQVIEGIAPIWVDLNGDEERDIVVTLSDAGRGAQLVVFDDEGEMIAASEPIGQGFRWRHQIAVASFGPEGEMEVADVLTPHLGGVVEFFQVEGDSLEIQAQIEGYTSHLLGSRNLDMAAAGDFDGDGMIELLLPNQALSELGAIQRLDGDAIVDWVLPLDGQLNTNVGATTLDDGSILVGIGRSDGVLRVWGY